MVLHNSFTFSLDFVLFFFVFHLQILMNFVLCFASVAEDSCRLLQCRNFKVCEISQPPARTVHLPLLRLLQPLVSYEIH